MWVTRLLDRGGDTACDADDRSDDDEDDEVKAEGSVERLECDGLRRGGFETLRRRRGDSAVAADDTALCGISREMSADSVEAEGEEESDDGMEKEDDGDGG
jgi:hypothetical protein